MPIFIETEEDINPFAGATIGGGYDGPSPVRTDEYGRSRAPDWSVGDYPSRINVDHGPTGYDRDQWGSDEGGWDMSGIEELFHDTKDRYSQWSDQSPELWYNKEYTRSHPTFGWQSSPGSTMVQKDWMDQQARLGFPANLDYQANVTDEYGRSRKYSHYPENIWETWGRSTDEYGKESPNYIDLLQQMDVDIYGKPRSYPGSNIEERGKSLMETIYNPEPTRGRALWEPDYVAELSDKQGNWMDSPIGSPDFYSNFDDYFDAVTLQEDKGGILPWWLGGRSPQEPATQQEVLDKLNQMMKEKNQRLPWPVV